MSTPNARYRPSTVNAEIPADRGSNLEHKIAIFNLKIFSENILKPASYGAAKRGMPSPVTGRIGGRMLHPKSNVSGSSLVLLVDDDAQIRNLLRAVLLQGDYQVLAASNGEEALQISDRCAATIHILVTDLEIGTMNGFELSTRIRQQRPTIPVLFISGNTEVSRMFPRSRSFLEKPFTNPVFLDRVASLLHQATPSVVVPTPLGI